MKKNNSGITLISLVITIILLILIASIGINSGINTINSSKLTKFTTEMKIMQNKVNELYESYYNNRTVKLSGDNTEYIGNITSEGEKKGIQDIGKELSEFQGNLDMAFLESTSGITDKTGYKYYDSSIIKSLGIDNIEHEFFVNVSKRSIISTEPLNYNGNSYYTLKQLPDSEYNVEYDDSLGNVDFKLTSEIKEGKQKLVITEITSNKNIDKWQVEYRLKTEKETSWITTEKFKGNTTNVVLDKIGKYQVKIIYDDNMSSEIKETGIQVGDYINYTYDDADNYNLKSAENGTDSDSEIVQTKDLKWKILKIYDDGEIDLISEKPTDQEVYFKGALGYNNGVYILNDISKKQYSNKKLGVQARNLNIEDIENQLNSKGISARNNYINGANIRYNNSKTYQDGNANYPVLFAKENGSGINTEIPKNDGIGKSENGYEISTTETKDKANKILVNQTLYNTDDITYFDNQNIYEIIYNTGKNYWLATRYTDCLELANFGLRAIGDNKGYNMLNSDDSTGEGKAYLRPIVTLKSDIKITTQTEGNQLSK